MVVMGVLKAVLLEHLAALVVLTQVVAVVEQVTSNLLAVMAAPASLFLN
jgi:hypothetical protein